MDPEQILGKGFSPQKLDKITFFLISWVYDYQMKIKISTLSKSILMLKITITLDLLKPMKCNCKRFV